MSTIEKLSIQGIRSFGPEDSDKQIINFFTPLTLILGPNGTGKTTIIECLKYMTTGVMPPGSKGVAFIHDPKIAHEREVKGQIRLQFKDVSGQTCIVQRSMVATQKLKKIEMRTLDGVITRRDRRTGEKKSISSKCAEIDREMITSLGVSKPVLENVIFCHQEDSNWPLIEGKSLKEKFDAIFASTRYVKALETIRKLKQEQDQKIKMYKQEICFLKQHKDKAAELERDMSEWEAKLVASRESVEKVKEQLQPIENKLDQIGARSADIYKIQNNITKLTSEMKQVEKTAKELEDNIENEFSGSTEELKRALKDFQEKVQEREDTLAQFDKRAEDLSKELNKLGREKSVILVEVGKMEQEAENQENNIRKRDDLIRKIAKKYGFGDFSRGTITDDKCGSFIEAIRHKLEGLVNDGKSIKAKFEEEEIDLQKQIDDCRDKKSKLEQNERIKRDMVKDNNNKIRQINKKLSEVVASAGRLDQLTTELKRAERELQNVEESVNPHQLKTDINDMLKEKSQKDIKINELSTEINRLHLQSSTQAQLDVLKKDKSSKEDNIRRLKAKNEDTINYILGHIPSRNIRGEMDDYIGKQTESVRKCSLQVQKNRNEISTKETEKKMVGEQLRKKEEELKGLEDKISSVCGSERFEEGLATIQQKMNQSQDQRGSLLGAEHFFKKYVEDFEKKDPCCPLCHREFDTDQEVRELVLELRNKLRLVPSKLERAEHDIEEFQEKYDSLQQLRPLQKNISILEQNEVPELKKRLKRITEDLEKLKITSQDKEEEMSTKEGDQCMAKEMQPDIVMMDRYYGEVSELEKKIATQSALLSGGDSDRTLQDAISEKEEFQLQLDSITQRLDRKRQKLSDHSEQIQRNHSNINTLKEEKLKIDSDLQQRYKHEEDKAMLLSESEKHDKEIRETAEQIRPLGIQINKLCREKEELAQTKETQVEKVKTEIDVVKNNGNKVKNVNNDIKSYAESGKDEKLDKKKKQRDAIQTKINRQEEEQQELTQNIDKLRKDLATTQVRERELTDNLQLRSKMKEIENMNAQVDELQSKQGGFDVRNLERERRNMLQKQEQLTRDRHLAEGRQRGFEDQIRGVKNELESDMYKGAIDKYKNQVITFRTTELANNDLEKYYRALDKAIMNYHIRKMEEINKIICELWKNTYRGTDIETIEIRSDDDDSGISKTRRNYNYRVVMVKGDAVLDMRGRCSAGQKVLASLIIRLALAETFCLNCGILALDEPTTNLDRENIESLAYALVEIIKSRSVQRNFQLVIITHDEDFVELLGRSEFVDRFFKVMKNSAGCSRLVDADVQTLHTH